MKTVASLADVKRLALATGAEVKTAHGSFNAGRAQVAAAPVAPIRPQPAPVAAPAPDAPASLTREEVAALMTGHARAMQAQLEQKQAQIDRLHAECAALQRQAWRVSIAYDADGAITEVTQRPA